MIARRHGATGVAFAVALGLVASGASAQDIAAAEALFREGKALLEHGGYAEACSKLAESQRLDASSGTLLNLAACHEKQNKTATAWAEFLAAARLAHTQGREERVAEARLRARELEPKLSTLTIRVDKPVPGIEIRRDDVLLEASSIGSKIPTDPGSHVVVVTAPGYEGVSLSVTLAAVADAQTVVIPEMRRAQAAAESRALEPAIAAGEPKQKAEAPPPASPARLPDENRESRGGDRTLAWVVGGAGAAFLATGSVFGVLALSAYDDAKQKCPSRKDCDASATEARSRAETRANIANVGVGLGAVGVGVGLVLLLIPGPSTRSDSARPSLVPEVGTHSAGVTLTGAF